MTNSQRRGLALGVALAAALGAGPARAADGPPAQEARRILAQTGVQGGLIVHLGCGDGTLTAALRASDRYAVHGLDTDPANVAKARAHVQSLGLTGPVAIARWRGGRLPYVANLVNLIVSTGEPGVSREEMLRVLAPHGVATVQRGGAWQKTVKPWPQAIDQWTHYLHDASNNAVAQDTVVGPPRRLQWVGGPRWLRHHDHMSGLSAMVSARGGSSPSLTSGRGGRCRCPRGGLSWPATRSTARGCGSGASPSGTLTSGR